jgi:hypothetical protein
MERDRISWLDLTPEPRPDAPEGLRRAPVILRLPVHPLAKPVRFDHSALDPGPMRLMQYVKKSQPISYLVPLDVQSTCQWFESILPENGYKQTRYTAQSSLAEGFNWIIMQVESLKRRDVVAQLTLRPNDHSTIVTYSAEHYLTPPRDPAAALPLDADRIEVEYTFLEPNGHYRNLQYMIEDAGDIQALTEAVNAFSRDTRTIVHARGIDATATLRFVTRDQSNRLVHVDPAHQMVSLDTGEILLGDVWPLLRSITSIG